MVAISQWRIQRGAHGARAPPLHVLLSSLFIDFITAEPKPSL